MIKIHYIFKIRETTYIMIFSTGLLRLSVFHELNLTQLHLYFKGFIQELWCEKENLTLLRDYFRCFKPFNQKKNHQNLNTAKYSKSLNFWGIYSNILILLQTCIPEKFSAFHTVPRLHNIITKINSQVFKHVF